MIITKKKLKKIIDERLDLEKELIQANLLMTFQERISDYLKSETNRILSAYVEEVNNLENELKDLKNKLKTNRKL